MDKFLGFLEAYKKVSWMYIRKEYPFKVVKMNKKKGTTDVMVKPIMYQHVLLTIEVVRYSQSVKITHIVRSYLNVARSM